jgi:hypothetical protein
VNLSFHVIQPPGQSWQLCLPRLASNITVNGQEFTSQVDDAQGQFVLSPGVDQPAARTVAKLVAGKTARRGR